MAQAPPRPTQRTAHRNWPAEAFGSLSHTTATTSPGSITAQPVSPGCEFDVLRSQL
jgi:hypothetical protein